MKILIAYDGSPHADVALDDLKRAGLPDNTDAIVLSVADVFVMPPDATGAPDVSARVAASFAESQAIAQRAVEDAHDLASVTAERLRHDFPGWSIQASATANSPVWGILQAAEEANVDVIVVGSQGRTSMGRWLLGSVSHAVLTHARCSVRIARGLGSEADKPVRIIAGVDGSREAEAAIHAILRRVWPRDTDVRVVSALDSSLRTASKMPHIEPWIREQDEHSDDWVHHLAESVVAQLRAANLSASSIAVEGDPKKVLIEEAERFNADSIFVGARGLTMVDRLLLGSVSAAVATRAHCTVEVVRRAQTEPIAGN